jgi:hypothetical protein
MHLLQQYIQLTEANSLPALAATKKMNTTTSPSQKQIPDSLQAVQEQNISIPQFPTSSNPPRKASTYPTAGIESRD